MSSTPQLLGDVPLEILLKENPDHELHDWVIESYLMGETLRTRRDAANAIQLIDCVAAHALHPDGSQSEQACVFRKLSGVCLHGEQWDSGLGIIRQFVQSASAIKLANKEEVATITNAQHVLGDMDAATHRDAPGVRDGRYSLAVVRNRASNCQNSIGEHVFAVRDAIAERALAVLEIPYETWKTLSQRPLA